MSGISRRLLDGPENVHDACRRTDGAFKTLIQGVTAVRDWRSRLKKARPFVVTSTTLSRRNAECLDQTYEIGRTLNPDIMAVFLSWFTSEQLGKAHHELLRQSLGVEAFTGKLCAEFSLEDAKFVRSNGPRGWQEVAVRSSGDTEPQGD